jgi:hypothetical protein
MGDEIGAINATLGNANGSYFAASSSRFFLLGS